MISGAGSREIFYFHRERVRKKKKNSAFSIQQPEHDVEEDRGRKVKEFDVLTKGTHCTII
jgi:hypothetical protein